MDWFQKEYPDYYQAVVFELTPEMKADPNRHYFKATRDFRYNHLISEPMKAWLSHGKKWKNKEKGLVYGPSHLSKYCDAILRGGDYCGGPNVTQEYYDEMHAYIERMKREKAVAKQNNQIEEKDADTSEKEDGSGRFAAPVKLFRHIAPKMLMESGYME